MQLCLFYYCYCLLQLFFFFFFGRCCNWIANWRQVCCLSLLFALSKRWRRLHREMERGVGRKGRVRQVEGDRQRKVGKDKLQTQTELLLPHAGCQLFLIEHNATPRSTYAITWLSSMLTLIAFQFSFNSCWKLFSYRTALSTLANEA